MHDAKVPLSASRFNCAQCYIYRLETRPLPPSSPPHPGSELLIEILRAMSPQRLYDLNRSSTQFSYQLDKLLHEKGYVDELQKLPEGELVRLVNYLNIVRYPQCKPDPTHRSHRSWTVSIAPVTRLESAFTCYRRYVTRERCSQQPTNWLGCDWFQTTHPRTEDSAMYVGEPSPKMSALNNSGSPPTGIGKRSNRYLIH